MAAFSFIELAQGFGLLAILAFVPAYVFRRRHALAVAREATAEAYAGVARRPQAARDGAAAALQAVGIAVFLLTAMNATGAWRWLWQPNGVADLNRLVFPDLNGEWQGVLLSNGRNTDLRPPPSPTQPDCSVFGIARIEDFACIKVAVSIDMSFFDTRVTLKSGPSISHTKAVWLRRGQDGQEPRILYIYVVTNPGSRILDDRAFNGAAELLFDAKEWALEGGYWSDRNWASGQNTAGRIRLTKVRGS